MASPCFEDDIPYPVSEEFADGEKAVSVNADITNVLTGAYLMAKMFDFNGGMYTLKGIGVDAARWTIGFEAQSGRVIFGSTAILGVQQVDVYIPKGRQRIDVMLQALGVPTGTAYIAFSIFQGTQLIYASAADGWVYDVTLIPDEDIPGLEDPRLAMSVFPLLPNWQDGVIERLEWSTEIFQSETDIEQRRALRRFARRSVEAAFLRKKEQRSRIDIFVSAFGKDEVLVPLWFEQYILPEPFLTTTPEIQFPAGEVIKREFRIGDMVVFMAKSPDVLNRALITDIVGDLITFSMIEDDDPQDWDAGSRVIPLRVARIEDDAALENLTDAVARVSIRFNLSDPETQFVDSGDPDMNIFPFLPEWSSPIEIKTGRLDYLFDNVYGRKQLTDLMSRTRMDAKMNLRMFGRDQGIAVRHFLGTRRGRQMRFWLPTFTSDLLLKQNITGTDWVCHNIGFSRYMRIPLVARRTVQLVLKNGDYTIFTIQSCTQTSDTTEVFEMDAYYADVDMADVSRISFIMEVRFDQDAFELTHYADNLSAVELPLVFHSMEGDWDFTWPDMGGGPPPPPPPPPDG